MSRPTRILVLGADGQLGRALVDTLQARPDWDVVPCGRERIDVTDSPGVRALVRDHRPAWVVNCVALTNVDYCEDHPDETEATNVKPVAALAAACNETESRFVQIGTDFVFDGKLDRPYREDDPPNPLNVYARSKLLAEQQAGACDRTLIVRTAWLYGLGERSFVAKILARAAAGSPLCVVSDQIGSPSYAPDLAECIERLMHLDARGVYHVVNGGQASWYELARRAVELAGFDVPVSPIASTDYESPVTRPANSALDCEKYVTLTGHRPRPWAAALEVHIRSRSEASRQSR